jgi:hypothetical protein
MATHTTLSGPTSIPTWYGTVAVSLIRKVLFFICWLTFGSYWVYDTPGAIQKQLQAWFSPQNYTDSMNLALYYAYSYPNIILAFFGWDLCVLLF